jgi:dihydropteroate synthase
MGILNVTPDSFSDGGEHFEHARAVERAWQIAEEGADLLDIGGESTRPGSTGIPADVELDRVLPVLESLRGKYPIPISVDTSRIEVARPALEAGAVLVNDVTSLVRSPEIGTEVARKGAGIILMHMRGIPETMQALPPSEDILGEIDSWALEAVARAQKCGVSSEKIVLDPGIGFGKTPGQNLEILANLGRLAGAGYPILVGTSRKSFIGKILNRPVKDRIWGTAGTVAASILEGAHIVRVHDVAPMKELALVVDALVSERSRE